MDEKTAIKLFESNKIRTQWSIEEEEWYFSIIDVIAILTENDYQAARNYWKVLKYRLIREGNETVTNCNQFRLVAPDGKMRFTDVAKTEQLFKEEDEVFVHAIKTGILCNALNNSTRDCYDETSNMG